MGELPAQRPGDVTVLDMEASIEHLTRGTVRNVDLLLLVAEPYFRSLETLGRMAPLAQELGVPALQAVANKVRAPQDEAAIREYTERRGIAVAGVVPWDESVVAADRAGRALVDHAPAAPAVQALSALADRLERQWLRAGAPA